MAKALGGPGDKGKTNPEVGLIQSLQFPRASKNTRILYERERESLAAQTVPPRVHNNNKPRFLVPYS